jgi:hypothetical protein
VTERVLYPGLHDGDAPALWRVADALNAQAAELELEARELREESRRVKNLAAAIADGRRLEVTP